MIIKGEQYVFKIDDLTFHCALDVTMNYVGGKWKTVVLWYLRHDTLRFSELKQHIPQITEKMLSIQLKALTAEGLVRRTVLPEVPPRVEYALTEEGRTLLPMLEEMAKWGKNYAAKKGKLEKLKEV